MDTPKRWVANLLATLWASIFLRRRRKKRVRIPARLVIACECYKIK